LVHRVLHNSNARTQRIRIRLSYEYAGMCSSPRILPSGHTNSKRLLYPYRFHMSTPLLAVHSQHIYDLFLCISMLFSFF
jgi:hypothetical protein